MPRIIHKEDIDYKEKKSPVPEYEWKTTEDFAAAAGLKDFCCNVRMLEKGKYSYPYHFHYNADEMFVILSGTGELRLPGGIESVRAGDIVLFERGASSAHQIFNGNDDALVYLDLMSFNNLDVCEYPDSGKINILPQREIFKRGDDAGYFNGEENVGKVWDDLRKNK